MSSIDEQFVDFIVKSLVSNPDAVVVQRTIDEKGVLLELTVDPEDLGRVIGKRGATAQSLRTLLRALGTKNDARYNLKIVDNGPGPQAREDNNARNDSSQADGQATDNAADDTITDDQAVDDQVAAEDALNEDTDALTLAEEDEDDDQQSSLASKTRKELEELDDLDV